MRYYISGAYKISYHSPPGGGIYQVCWGRISSCEEGRGISWLLGRKQHEIKIKGKQDHLPYNIKAVGKNIRGGRGKGDAKFWEENQDLINWGSGGRITSCMELNTPFISSIRQINATITAHKKKLF